MRSLYAKVPIDLAYKSTYLRAVHGTHFGLDGFALQLEELCGILERNPCKYVLISCTSSNSNSSSCESITQQQQERLEWMFSSAVSSVDTRREGPRHSAVRTRESPRPVEVMDRTQLVLEIFARRANNQFAKMQVGLCLCI